MIRAAAGPLALLFLLIPCVAHAQTAALEGVVVDDSGAVLPGAMVVLRADGGGRPRETTTGSTGAFAFRDAPRGGATVHVELAGFLPGDVRVEIATASGEPVTIRLKIGFGEEVTVSASDASGGVLAPAKNADAIEFDPETLRRLPTDAQDLRGLVDSFTAASPTGGVSVVVDGVETDGADVPASAIHRLVINRNPYSVEFKSPGKARVEVETQRGSHRFYHGSGALFFRDSALQAQSAFAGSKPDLTRALDEATMGGPLPAKGWSFFISGQHLIDDGTAIVSALTPAGPLLQNVAAPERRSTLFGRADVRPNKTDALTLRYDLFDDADQNHGVGGLRLAEQGYRTLERRHRLQINDHRVVSGGVLNDFRIETTTTGRDDGAPATAPSVVVEGAFVAGPSQVFTRSHSTTFQAQDTAALTIAAHPVRLGARVKTRHSDVTDATNFGGTYRFQTLADMSAGRPFLFSRRSGRSDVAFTGADADVFAETSFRPASSVGVTAGVRYDLDTRVADWNNVAPRVVAAFAPAGRRTVLRGGVGLFYQSLPTDAAARALLFGPGGLRETSIANPSFPAAPGDAAPGAPASQWTLAQPLESPQTLQTSVAVERTLGRRTTATAEYLRLRTRHAFRSRDVNAPRDGALERPDPSRLNVFQIASTGEGRSDALTLTFRGRLAAFRGTAQYTLSKATDDASNVFDVPADSVTMAGETGRADYDRRHKLNVAGAYGWKQDRVRLGAVLAVASGAPFNILTGSDTNRDLIVNDRPSGVVRNAGDGSAFAQLDLRFTTALRAPRPPSDDPESGRREQIDNLELTLDLFNALDRVNPTGFVGAVSSPLFGRATAARTPRTAQLSLRYRF